MAKWRKTIATGLVALLLGGTLAACGGGSSTGGTSGTFKLDPTADVKGQTIKVLLPYKIPSAALAEFTKQTGVKVEFQTAGWDSVASKLNVANQAGTYIADVSEFDWSWTGQAGGNGWYEPLEHAIDPKVLADISATNGSFKYQNRQYAACYSNDFRVSNYNSQLLEEAGIKQFPRTFAELEGDLEQLKSSGVVEAPMSIAMAATEGGVTPWYLFTMALGGSLFDENFKPLFNQPGSPGMKALEFEVDALKKGWVSPGAVTQDDVPAFEKFKGGFSAIYPASESGGIVSASNPKESSIANVVKAGLVPGVDGPGASFGLPEGLGIPVTAEHKEAAVAFIDWFLRPQQQIQTYEKMSLLPCGQTALNQLSKRGELIGGQTMVEQLEHVKPLFPQGAPVWYGRFTSEAQGVLNAAFTGNMSVEDALDKLAETAEELQQQSG